MGERCMKDTVHPPVHPSVHPAARTSVTTTSPCRSSGTHFGRGQNTGMGWNDPGLATFPRSKNLRGRSSPVFCPWLFLHIDRNNAGDRVPRVKTAKNAFCTLGASTSSPSLQISTAFSRNSHDCMCETPRAQYPQIGRERPRFFGFQPPKKFSGSLPPDVGLRRARFLANARQPRSLPTGFQFWVKWASRYTCTLATPHHAAGVTACVRPRKRVLSNKPYAAPHTTCPTRLHYERRRVLVTLKGTT